MRYAASRDGRRRFDRAVAATPAVVVLAAACAPISDPVPVSAAPGALEFLVGAWTGEYEGFDSGRSGTLTFALEAGADTAHGHVLMLPGHDAGLYTRLPADGAAPRASRRAPQPVGIRFVRLSNDAIEGVLEPYEDPACGCPLTTIFLGRIEGNVIRGTFETVHGRSGDTERGTWRAQREE
ncbi:MAG TPA: hypothetical protein VK837_06305 [Longimicrobiales bacterium]|nr:hypothetical protein [Longimicrobiales bacterium]